MSNNKEVGEIIKELKTDSVKGLNDKQVEAKRAEFGENKLAE